MTNDPHQFTREAWEANAEVWDARMGDEGNDFFNVLCWPVFEFNEFAKLCSRRYFQLPFPSI